LDIRRGIGALRNATGKQRRVALEFVLEHLQVRADFQRDHLVDTCHAALLRFGERCFGREIHRVHAGEAFEMTRDVAVQRPQTGVMEPVDDALRYIHPREKSPWNVPIRISPKKMGREFADRSAAQFGGQP